jgi:hypothetical protein
MLMENPHPDLRAYIVWGPFLQGDNESAARHGTEKYMAPQAVYFWASSQRIALEMGPVLKLASGRIPWDVYLLFAKGEIWDRGFPRPTYWQHQMDYLQGDKLNPAVFKARILDQLRRP